MAELNRALGLRGRYELATPSPDGPSWFVGDVETLEPNKWALVISLNQKQHDAGRGYTAQTYWDHWRFLTTNHWYAKFYRRFVRLASAALGTTVSLEEERHFATSSIVFVELCPYSSHEWGFRDEDVARLVREDRGFQIKSRVRQILVDHAHPALVMVNGKPALPVLEQLEGDRFQFGARTIYPSVHDPRKRLWHREGAAHTGDSSVPLIGFPQRTPTTHNANKEIDQLGEYARALVQRHAATPQPPPTPESTGARW